ncbi:MAG: maleylpyruvate isomerase family mycothiol-dependent enzyme [Motilibacteraceae bacterium]
MTTTSTRLPADRYLALLRADGERLAQVADGALEAPVPPCPGWSVRDAVVHTASVYGHKAACIRLGRRPEEGEWATEPAAGVDVVAWFRATLHDLTALLEQHGPDAAAYTWWPPEQTTGFWFRRMALETAVHRVDVESAVGQVTAVDDDLAVDGVDEVLALMLGSEDWTQDPVPGNEGLVAVRTGDRAWRVELRPDAVTVTEGVGAAEATVTGEPSELFLWLWGRRPDEAVRVEGDDAAVRRLRERISLATQ